MSPPRVSGPWLDLSRVNLRTPWTFILQPMDVELSDEYRHMKICENRAHSSTTRRVGLPSTAAPDNWSSPLQRTPTFSSRRSLFRKIALTPLKMTEAYWKWPLTAFSWRYLDSCPSETGHKGRHFRKCSSINPSTWDHPWSILTTQARVVIKLEDASRIGKDGSDFLRARQPEWVEFRSESQWIQRILGFNRIYASEVLKVMQALFFLFPAIRDIPASPMSFDRLTTLYGFHGIF